MIPLVDLDAQYRQIKAEVGDMINEVIGSRAFIQGRYVTAFEQGFCRLQQAAHTVGCANGTAALFLALLAAGIGAGDEVLTVPNSFIATAEAICHTGAVPVFVDIDPATHTMDPALIEARITPRTKAILPVHLYGNPADMDAIMEIARNHGIRVIEDCAQAHLATYRSRPVGTLGDAGAFSFYPGKNLGAYGDAGAVITGDAGLAHRIRLLADHGRESKYVHSIIGYNQRMDGLQAGILLVKLKYLQRWTEQRRANARRYAALLSGVGGVQLPASCEGADHVYHLYVVQVPDRDRVVSSLQENGVAAGIHYPLPLHLQPALQHLGYREGDFPAAEHAARHVVSLPMYPELTLEQIERVCTLLAQAVA